jgi:thioredoxin-related protein
MNKLIIFFLTVLLIAISCNVKDDFERQDEIINYIRDLNTVNYGNKNMLIVFLTGGCGECHEETINLINDLDCERHYKNYKKLLIISENNLEYKNSLEIYNFKKIEESFYSLSKHGVNFYDNLVIVFNSKGKVIKWDWLKNENIVKVRKNFNL